MFKKAYHHFKGSFILSLIHALWLLFFTFLLQYTDFIRFDEIAFLKGLSNFKYNLLKLDPKPEQQNTIFIDVSKDLALTDATDVKLGGFPPYQGAKTLITDRGKLAQFFSILMQHPGEYRYVLCDILFETPSQQDSALNAVISPMRKIIVSAIAGPDSSISGPLFHVNSGAVNYFQNTADYFKLAVFYGGSEQKSLPAKMYEELSCKHFSRKGGLTFLDDKLVFNKIFTELYIRKSDLRFKRENGHDATLFYLGALLQKRSGLFNTYLRNKTIVMGNFSGGDDHDTYQGKQPGALILWDTFLTLKYKCVTLSLYWVLVLFVIYFAISSNIFNHRKFIWTKALEKIEFQFLRRYLSLYLSFLGVCILISIITYLAQGLIISIFYLASYLTLVDIVVDKWKERKTKPIKAILKEL